MEIKPKSDKMFVSIIIPTYNDWHLLARCLRALACQSYPREHFEVIVVNNEPTSIMPKNFDLPTGFHLITEKKPGSYAARNAGIKKAAGDIVGFTDSDCIPDTNWIKNAVDYFNKNKSCTRIAGQVSVFFASSTPTKAELFDKVYAFPQRLYVASSGAAVTANMFTYKQVFDKVGFFDENLMSGGDILWGKIACKANNQIDYVEEVMVKHPATKTISHLTKRARRYAGGTIQNYQNHGSKGISFFRFLSSLRSRIRHIKYVYEKNVDHGIEKELTSFETLSIFMLKNYLICVRAIELFRVHMGKKPNRT